MSKCNFFRQLCERRYLDMDEFAEWATARTAAIEGNNVVALAG